MRDISPEEAQVPPEAPNGRRIIIVGNGHRAAVAYECFRHDSPHAVAAFSAEERFISTDTYCGLPLVPFEHIASAYSPQRYLAFVAVSPAHANRTRRRLYDAVKSAGYTCASYISSRAFAVRNAEVGENTFVCDHAALQHMVRLGNNVFIGSGTCVGHSTVVEDHCFVGQNATIAGFCRIGRGSSLGSSSCIADVTRISEECVLSPGAVVLKDTTPGKVYTGNPARPGQP